VKPRHAAALALVGWYLIAPGDKFETDSGGGLMPTEWFRLGKFDTEAQCEQAWQKIQTAATKAYEQDQLAHRKDTFHLGDAGECEDATINPGVSGWPAGKPN
jgi:hypothetical protein